MGGLGGVGGSGPHADRLPGGRVGLVRQAFLLSHDRPERVRRRAERAAEVVTAGVGALRARADDAHVDPAALTADLDLNERAAGADPGDRASVREGLAVAEAGAADAERDLARNSDVDV